MPWPWDEIFVWEFCDQSGDIVLQDPSPITILLHQKFQSECYCSCLSPTAQRFHSEVSNSLSSFLDYIEFLQMGGLGTHELYWSVFHDYALRLAILLGAGSHWLRVPSSEFLVLVTCNVCRYVVVEYMDGSPQVYSVSYACDAKRKNSYFNANLMFMLFTTYPKRSLITNNQQWWMMLLMHIHVNIGGTFRCISWINYVIYAFISSSLQLCHSITFLAIFLIIAKQSTLPSLIHESFLIIFSNALATIILNSCLTSPVIWIFHSSSIWLLTCFTERLFMSCAAFNTLLTALLILSPSGSSSSEDTTWGCCLLHVCSSSALECFAGGNESCFLHFGDGGSIISSLLHRQQRSTLILSLGDAPTLLPAFHPIRCCSSIIHVPISCQRETKLKKSIHALRVKVFTSVAWASCTASRNLSVGNQPATRHMFESAWEIVSLVAHTTYLTSSKNLSEHARPRLHAGRLRT